MNTRLLGWATVACCLVVLWTLNLRQPAQGREVNLAQAATDEAAPVASERRVPAQVVDRSSVDSTDALDESKQLAEFRRERRMRGLVSGITIFVIAIFLGVELINRVPATLHTPLMSGSNAISGITVVGAIIAAGVGGRFAPFLAFVAVVLAMINVVGGFLVTHRMLLMFKRR